MTDSKAATEQFAQLVEDYGDVCDLCGASSTRARGMFGLIRDKYEQAIAATLGSGTLTAEQVGEVIGRCIKFYEGGDYDEQEIADELNAMLENKECEMETDWDYLHDGIPDAPEDTWAYKCSACDWSFRYDRGIRPTFCPNCGRKVMER